jgi:P27 family predicted phage terminase small subunit
MAGNHNSGRRKLPNAELELRGSRWFREDEPERIPCELTKPDGMRTAAARFFDDYYPQLLATGVLSATDSTTFLMLCEKYADWEEARMLIRTRGEYVKITNAKGEAIGAKVAPWTTRERDCFDAFIKLSHEFGLTPSSRGNIQVSPAIDVLKDMDSIT